MNDLAECAVPLGEYNTVTTSSDATPNVSYTTGSGSLKQDAVAIKSEDCHTNRGFHDHLIVAKPKLPHLSDHLPVPLLEKKYENEEEKEFTINLFHFMAERGHVITKIPSLGFQDLNLFKLYESVIKRGGMEKVSKFQEWKNVYMDLGLSTMSTSASYNTRTNYKKYLYLYELEHFKPYEGSAKADYLYAIHDYVKIFSELQRCTYYAQIIQRRVGEDRLNTYYVHYNGWSTSHDEWMPEHVLKKLTDEESVNPALLKNPTPTRSSRSNYLIFDPNVMNEKKISTLKKKKYDSDSESSLSRIPKKSKRTSSLSFSSAYDTGTEDEAFDDSISFMDIMPSPFDSHLKLANLLKVEKENLSKSGKEHLSFQNCISPATKLLSMASQILTEAHDNKSNNNDINLEQLATISTMLVPSEVSSDTNSSSVIAPTVSDTTTIESDNAVDSTTQLIDINVAQITNIHQNNVESSTDNINDTLFSEEDLTTEEISDLELKKDVQMRRDAEEVGRQNARMEQGKGLPIQDDNASRSDSLSEKGPLRVSARSLRSGNNSLFSYNMINSLVSSPLVAKTGSTHGVPIASPTLLRGDIDLQKEKHERALLNQLPLKGRVDELPKISLYQMQEFRDVDSDGTTQIYLEDAASDMEALSAGPQTSKLTVTDRPKANLLFESRHRACILEDESSLRQVSLIKKIESLIPADINFQQEIEYLRKENEKILARVADEKRQLLKDLSEDIVLDKLRIPSKLSYFGSCNVGYIPSGTLSKSNKPRTKPEAPKTVNFLQGYESPTAFYDNNDIKILRNHQRLGEIKKEHASLMQKLHRGRLSDGNSTYSILTKGLSTKDSSLSESEQSETFLSKYTDDVVFKDAPRLERPNLVRVSLRSLKSA